MIQISDIINKEKDNLLIIKQNQKLKRFLIKIDPESFKELFLIEANKIIVKRNIESEFIITDQNKDIINQIYHYCTGNESKFNGQLNKGILLSGKNGIGKTLILQSFCSIINLMCNRVIYSIHSKKLQSKIKELGLDWFIKRPLLIDDIGKESKEINDYGTKILPLADLIALRYDEGSITFATCNYKLDTLTEFYGLTTTDRFKEMFNIIELTGKSFRE